MGKKHDSENMYRTRGAGIRTAFHRACLLLFLAVYLVAMSGYAQERVLDDFEKLTDWKPIVSDGVTLNIVSDEGHQGNAMRLDFNFVAGAGYAIAQKHFPLDLPDDYLFSFYLRAEAPVNNFEFKLLDAMGNVWWIKKLNVDFPSQWEKTIIRKRHLSFAWGPAGGGKIRSVDRIEFVVSAGKGGKGSVYIDDFKIETLQRKKEGTQRPAATASSSKNKTSPANAIDDSPKTIWMTDQNANQWFLYDLGNSAEFGGLVIEWDSTAYAAEYRVLTSEKGDTYSAVYEVREGNGGRDYIYLGEMEARYIRLDLKASSGKGFGIRSLKLMPAHYQDAQNKFFQEIAGEAERGLYPKYFQKEQTYWTVTGVSGDDKEALINEEGLIEIDKGKFSLEPFLFLNNRLITWNDVSASPSLEEGYLPIPIVTWAYKDVELKITMFATGDPGKSSLFSIYRIMNPTDQALTGKFFLAIRPFQVLPPWQALNLVGGVTHIKEIKFEEDKVTVGADKVIIPLSGPDRFGAVEFDQGDITEYLKSGKIPKHSSMSDHFGYGSAAFEYNFNVEANGYVDVTFEVPFHQLSQLPAIEQQRRPDFVQRKFEDTKAHWKSKLDRIDIHLPQVASSIVQTLKTSLGYIFIYLDGSAIQGGARTYDRSWIRDASYTIAALLRTGNAAEVRDFIKWYAPYQYANGKIPCVVDERGADPVNEHDSPGQFIYIVAEYFRFTRDTLFLREMFPRIVKTMEYIESLHNERKTEVYRSGNAEQRACYGLVPESISHEGYSAKPMHSYWDNFYIIKGLKDAVVIAKALAEHDFAGKWVNHLTESQKNLYASMRLAMANKGIDYIPGCVELGDFDATSTAIGIFPCGELDRIPQPFLKNTFDRYFNYFINRRDGKIDWKDYTPYEIRIINAFQMMGQKERAHELLNYFMNDRRPIGWNHWAEVVWRNAKEPKFIGDMPHLSMAADIVNVVRNMFVFEKEQEAALVLGAGISEEWLNREENITIKNFPTFYCTLSMSMQKVGESVVVELRSKNKTSPVKVVLKSPRAVPVKGVEADGKRLTSFTATEVMLEDIPSRVVLRY